MLRKLTLWGVLAFILALSACGEMPASVRFPTPEAIGDGWETGSLEDAGLDPRKIASLVAAIEAGKFQNLDGLLIVKEGKLVFEDYYRGYHRDRKHFLASVTKSVTSMLVGISIDQGYLAGVDQPLVDLLPAYAGLIAADPAKADIRLEHLLTMTAGLDWDENSYDYSDPRNDCRLMDTTDDAPALMLSRPIAHPPGEFFNYSGGNTMLLSAILQAKTGIRVDQYAKEVLFGPLGITDYNWETYGDGLTQTDGGLHMRPRDLAKLGYVMLNDGIWGGKQIVSQDWIEQSTRKRIKANLLADYGYQWWRMEQPVYFQNVESYFAAGTGGQQMLIFPKLGMLVVITSAVQNHDENTARNHIMVTNYILPAAIPMWPTWLVLWGWVLLTVAGLIYWFKDRIGAASMSFPIYAAWGLAIVFFGPLGALAYGVAGRQNRSDPAIWRAALQGAVFSTCGVTAALLCLTMVAAFLKPDGNITWLAIPFAFTFGWLIFRAPQWAARLGEGYLAAARRTFFSQILVTLLALAGQLGALILLEMRWFPFGEDVTHPLYWIQLIPAGVAGALLVFPYQCWLAWRERARILVMTTNPRIYFPIVD